MNNKTICVIKHVLRLFGLLVLALPAQAASFDCAKAGTNVEHLICDSQEISKLDDELHTAYKAAVQDKPQANAIKQAQKQWMKDRNGCADVDCVKRAYEARISSLKNARATMEEAVVARQGDATLTNQDKVETSIRSYAEEVCLAPKIDWRNYEWTLIRGSGQPVCEEMLAYLKSRPKDVAPPTCPDDRLPPNGNWTRPEVRDVSEEEKLAILRDVPDRYRQKPKGPFSYEQHITVSQKLRVIRGDITRDGIPESFLALGGYADLQKTCERSTRCAVSNTIFKGTYKYSIQLLSDSYDLLPMNENGTQVNWTHRSIYPNQLSLGELIYYKSQPYWLSQNMWGQAMHDDFAHSSARPDDPYSAIFSLAEIGVGPVVNGNKTPRFKDVTVIAIEHDPESNRVCRFGYFNRDNLKQNPPKTRR